MRLHNILIGVGACLAMTACSNEEPDFMTPDVETGNGITITACATDLMPQIVASRATETEKRAEEKEIKTLHLFFFNADGTPLTAVNPSVFDFYKKVTVAAGQQPVQNMPSGAFENQANLTNITVVAVANIFGESFRTAYNSTGDIVYGDPTDASTEVTIDHINKLTHWLYRITSDQVRKDVSKLPEPGMPMFGKLNGVDISKEQGAAITIPMQALMARVDVNVRLDANQTSHDHLLPTLHITKYGVANMPGAVPFSVDDFETYTTDTSRGSGLYNPELIDVSESQELMYDGQEAHSFSYYTYENVQRTTKTPDYPAGIDPDDDSQAQRWKPTIAPENASNLVMHGHYVTHQGLQYDAQFKIFLGSNTTDNFEVKRNHVYINNVVIRGLDYVRQDPSVYTFDGRVNVKTDNPIYISVVNERKIDAHATALPMDFYFLRVEEGTVDCHSNVDIEIMPDNSGNIPSWLRLEKVPARQMMTKYNGVDFPNEDGRVAGRGARDYFTTDLVTNTLKDNTKISIGNDYPVGTDPDGGSRTRVYVYIDENTDVNAPGYGDRTATLHIHYTNDNGEDRNRTLEIDQKGLVKLQGSWIGSDGATETINTYMEYYEEYLDHKDPLDKHLMPAEMYTGLKWGLEGVATNYSIVNNRNGFRDSYKVYSNGYEMTNWVLNRNGAVSLNSVKLFNDTEPATAFHYCSGKNKRNADGTRAGSNWYMPGIRELEYALVSNFSTFIEFQGDYLYWSASAGKNTGNSENTSTARATRIKGMNAQGRPDYEESSGNNPGAQARGNRLRIRAFYRPN